MTPGWGLTGRARIAVLAVAGVVAVLAVAVVVAAVLTGRPAFFGGYHDLERRYTSLQSSAHRDLACGQCHTDRRGALLSGAARVGDFYRGLARKPASPTFSKLAKPTNAACTTCHREDWSEDASRTMKIPHPAHLRVASETRECVTCHKWTAHEEEYTEKHKKMPFSTVCASFGCHVGWKQSDECASCHHTLQESKGSWKAIHKDTVRERGPNACLETCHTSDQCRMCHTTGKRPQFASTAATAGAQAIERLHVKKDWMSKHGGIALADQNRCLACHVSIGECQDCHSVRPAFHGGKDTWLNAHQPLGKKNERRCLACHEKKWCEACHKQFKEMR